MNPVHGLAHHESLVAQWLEHPIGLRKVLGSISVADSRFFSLSHARERMNTASFSFHLSTIMFTQKGTYN